jgi:transmembrane sensor
MGTDDADRWAQLDDYFADRLPLGDRLELERWVAEREDRQQLIAQLREIWQRAGAESVAPDVGPVDIRQVLNALAEKRHAIDAAAARGALGGVQRTSAEVIPMSAYRGGTRPKERHLLVGAAIAASLVIGAGFTLYMQHSRHAASAVIPPAREIATKSGQRATLDLADGSRVVLAAGSRLRIPGDFDVRRGGARRRELYLEGKAYFEVKHDSTRPFIVRTATAVTEDLGTEFVVSGYPEMRATQVAVVSGRVALRAMSQPQQSRLTLLRPGDVGRLDTTGRTTVARNVALAPYLSWTRGVLAFDAVPLREALAELSRWYDVEFELRGPGKSRFDSLRITGEFREEPVNLAMQRLALMLGARVTQVGRTIQLSPKRSSP